MITFKAQVRDQLAAASTWMTVQQLVDLIPDAGYETVSRALRKLYGCVDRRVLLHHGRQLKEWARSNTLGALLRQKGISMNTNTLETVTEALVTEFVAAKKTFSVFEVTEELRKRVNAGTITLDKAETGTVHVDGVEVAKVDHGKVKGIVHDLFGTGKLASYDRTHNGTFWAYAPAPDVASASSAPSAPNNTPYDGSSTL